MLGVRIAALPASLRRTNQRTVISLLMRLGCASRADLAKAAGISQPTAGKITAELLRLGILRLATGPESPRSADSLSPRLGRPGQLLQLEDRRPRFLAIELGVVETHLASLPVAVRLEDNWSVTFPTPSSPEKWAGALKRAAAGISAQNPWGVLVSVPGIVDETAGKVLFSPNLHWSEKVSLPQLVRETWDLPVLLVQEVRALALGHQTTDPGSEDFLLVDFNQGVGGAMVLDGKLYSHRIPLSGEIGHTPVAGNPRRCGCGAVGCLETLVSERGLLESLSGVLGQSSRNAGKTRLARADLVRHIEKHGLEPWLMGALDTTARVIAGALNVLGIRRVVITGLLTELRGCVEHLARGIETGALCGRFGAVTCEAAPHRRAAGLVGAGIDRLVFPVEENGRTISRHRA